MTEKPAGSGGRYSCWLAAELTGNWLLDGFESGATVLCGALSCGTLLCGTLAVSGGVIGGAAMAVIGGAGAALIWIVLPPSVNRASSGAVPVMVSVAPPLSSTKLDELNSLSLMASLAANDTTGSRTNESFSELPSELMLGFTVSGKCSNRVLVSFLRSSEETSSATPPMNIRLEDSWKMRSVPRKGISSVPMPCNGSIRR